MNVGHYALKRGGLLAPLSTSAGLSPDALTLTRSIERICLHLGESFSVRQTAEDAIASLDEAREQALSANWDGYGSKKIDPRAYSEAKHFLRALPTTTSPPEVTVDPDGEVSLTWTGGLRSIFSVSVGPAGRLSYAGLIGRGKVYGTEWFENEIPRAILDNLTATLATRRKPARK
jgi:hypothetical protein